VATIILLNGVGSVGKSSIARALQTITAEPFLHVAMDAFLDMMPARYWDHPDGVTFETVIVDDVLLENEMADYAALLAGFTFRTVGVFAPLDVLEARERERGDRLIGLARWQYDRVYQGKRYDLELDTSSSTPSECATLIKQKFGL